MDMKLAGRTVLVTGASKGIGRVVAQWFGREGCHLRLAARSEAGLGETAAMIRKESKVDVRTFALDLSRPESRDELAAANPDIDILVNNAGAIPGGSIDDVDEAAWRAGWDLKVYGYIGLCRSYLKLMRARNKSAKSAIGGVIVNIIGAGGESLRADYIAGGVGNAALMAFTRSLGSSSCEYGVRVVGVNPGPVDTERFGFIARKRAGAAYGDDGRWREFSQKLPFDRPGTCDEVAALVVFLASDHSAYTSGNIVTMDGGMSMGHLSK